MMAFLIPNELSIVFLTYDEIEAEENFAALTAVAPRALRVHGVKGFDNAHRHAGMLATTAQVITIDGDNRVIDKSFFDSKFVLDARDLNAVISLPARIAHNGLAYGNGGLKIWPRQMLTTLRTHERSRKIRNNIDFVWQIPYVPTRKIVTETRVTASPEQAYRSGFREGVRLTMKGGQSPRQAWPDLPAPEALSRHLTKGNSERLQIWCTVGADVKNGGWAMLGAQKGLLASFSEGFDLDSISDFDVLKEKWETEVARKPTNLQNLKAALEETKAQLETRLGWTEPMLSKSESQQFRDSYIPLRQLGRLEPIGFGAQIPRRLYRVSSSV